MLRIDLFRTTTFRLALAFSGFFAGGSLLLFLFIYFSTSVLEASRIDRLITADSERIAAQSPALVLDVVNLQLAGGPHEMDYVGLFDTDGTRIAGNVVTLPTTLPPDGKVYAVDALVENPRGLAPPNETLSIRASARPLGDGHLLIVGRTGQSLEQLRQTVLQALVVGLLPMILLSLAAGIFLSWRAQIRVRSMNLAADHIRQGQLRERLPTRGTRDEFDRLAQSVNRMLDDIERLLNELRATGDEIAHDLRTPLTSVRARLERTLGTAMSRSELETAVERAIQGLDRALSVITALLRIREIEAGQRRSGFGMVDLEELLLAIEDLYQPVAEEGGIAFRVVSNGPAPAFGDRDLLMEAVGNVVDNAIKFTPHGGLVTVSLSETADGKRIRVADTGPGIAKDEREMVFTRFYRSEKLRQIRGAGLGLSLVEAIGRLHDVSITIGDNAPGCVVDLNFGKPHQAAA